MVLDGFISGAAALLAHRFSPHIRDVLFRLAFIRRKGHRLLLDELHLDPLLDLSMRLGEGTGACLAMGLIEASVKLSREMATFSSAGVKRDFHELLFCSITVSNHYSWSKNLAFVDWGWAAIFFPIIGLLLGTVWCCSIFP
jgi:hypothetical protein